jgi:hypothetical protein
LKRKEVANLKLQIATRGESPTDDDGSRHVGSESCVTVSSSRATVVTKRRQRAGGPRCWVPKLLCCGSRAVDMPTKATRMGAARPGEPSAAASTHPPTGIGERGTYARVAQEPGMESRCSVARRNGTAREIEPAGRREVGARRSSNDAGELAPEDPAEPRSAPMNGLVGGRR